MRQAYRFFVVRAEMSEAYMTISEKHDRKMLWALEKADEYLHTAWKHSKVESREMNDINSAQMMVHTVIRVLKRSLESK